MEISLEKHPINEEMTTEVDSEPSQSEISWSYDDETMFIGAKEMKTSGENTR